MTVSFVEAPARGVWRVGRSPDPLSTSDPRPRDELSDPMTGNRFDSPTGKYSVLYFATQLEACYGETLARFRPDLELLALVAEEWAERGWMRVGDVPAAWRQRRIAVRATFAANNSSASTPSFLDIESMRTRETLRAELADVLVYYGYADLDVATVRGADRRITRWIAQWAYDQRDESGEPLFAGIRYVSRLNTDWECWAAFGDMRITEVERKPVLSTDKALRAVADTFQLRVF